VLHIRETKFGKSRLVPLHDSAMTSLREYDTLRGRIMPEPEDPSFFVSLTARRLIYAVVCPTFRALVNAAGVGLGAPHPPRIHELRHYADGWVMCPAVTFPLAGAAELVLQSA
jgi:integrase/recombinase XerD